MGKFKAEETEKEAIRMVAAMMAASARTAPKTRGVDNLKTMVLDGDDVKALADAMEDRSKEQPPHLAPLFVRDASNVRNSSAVLLIGVTGEPKKPEIPLDCGSCGYQACQKLINVGRRPGKDFNGPICIFEAIDLGIALGSAVKLASELNIDNRMMYTMGATAQKLGYLNADIVIGIPLSATGKSIYFDRK
jgi:uncharacterized ferredoxin-like protein